MNIYTVYEAKVRAMSAEAWAETIARYRADHPEATGSDRALKAVITIRMLAKAAREAAQ